MIFNYNFFERTDEGQKVYHTPSREELNHALRLSNMIVAKQPNGEKYAILQPSEFYDFTSWNYDTREEAEQDLQEMKNTICEFYQKMSKFTKANENCAFKEYNLYNN